MLTAPGERRIVGSGEVDAHHPEQGVKEPCGLAQRENGRGVAGSGRSRWRDPSTAAAHPVSFPDRLTPKSRLLRSRSSDAEVKVQRESDRRHPARQPRPGAAPHVPAEAYNSSRVYLCGVYLTGKLTASPAAPAWRPGSDRFRGQPHRHIAAANEGLIVGRPVRNAELRLIRGINLRLHPCRLAPAERPQKRGPSRPTGRSSYNNAAEMADIQDQLVAVLVPAGSSRWC